MDLFYDYIQPVYDALIFNGEILLWWYNKFFSYLCGTKFESLRIPALADNKIPIHLNQYILLLNFCHCGIS